MEPSIMSYQDFKLLPAEKKTATLIRLYDQYSVEELAKAWDKDKTAIYNLKYIYITKVGKKTSDTGKEKTKAVAKTQKHTVVKQEPKEEKQGQISLEQELQEPVNSPDSELRILLDTQNQKIQELERLLAEREQKSIEVNRAFQQEYEKQEAETQQLRKQLAEKENHENATLLQLEDENQMLKQRLADQNTARKRVEEENQRLNQQVAEHKQLQVELEEANQYLGQQLQEQEALQQEYEIKIGQQVLVKENLQNEYKQLEEANQKLNERVKEQENQFLEVIQEYEDSKKQEAKVAVPSQGILLTYNGEYSAGEVEKKLEKFKLFLEGSSRYLVDLTLTELPQPVLESDEPSHEQEAEDEKKNDFYQAEVEQLKLTVNELETELAKAKEDNWVKGYNALKAEETGLHSPESEYQKTPQSHNPCIRREHGITKYQTILVCERCNDKHKVFVSKDQKSVKCKKCGRSMVLRDATAEGFPNQDEFGNYYIAGKYKRLDERGQEISVHLVK